MTNEEAPKVTTIKKFDHKYILEQDCREYYLYCTEEIPDEEAKKYIERGLKKYGKYFNHVSAFIDGEEVELLYDYEKAPKFERVRRITGYLVGTLDRFNDAKAAEERQRVKHSVSRR